jgi:hypothetical protein
MTKDSYALNCNVPKSLAIINDRGQFEQFEPVSGPRHPPSVQLYRIFSWEKAFTHSTPEILKLTSVPPVHGHTIDYWKLPRVKCHIILYIFLQRAVNANSSSPEVALARKIYAKLLNVRGDPIANHVPYHRRGFRSGFGVPFRRGIFTCRRRFDIDEHGSFEFFAPAQLKLIRIRRTRNPVRRVR